MEKAKTSQSKQRMKKVEEHHHQSLVGRIVEKGFSSSSGHTPMRPPQASVLPFPVARHRSQGPHWAPPGSVAAGEEQEAEDNRDGTDYNPIAPYAKPPKRKERKGLDFSRWRELAGGRPPEEEQSEAQKAKFSTGRVGNGSSGGDSGVPVLGKDDLEMGIDGDVSAEKEGSEMSMDGGGQGSTLEVSEFIEQWGNGSNALGYALSKKGDIGIGEGGGLDYLTKASHANKCAGMEVVARSASSLADEIDVENCARLGQMSQEDIAEARDEIMGRMNPEVLEMLKKRGHNKMKGRRSARVSSEQKVKEKVVSGAGEGSNGELSGSKQAEDTKISGRQGLLLGSSELSSSGVHDNIAWRSWSERVEKVREMRFSCDGDLIPCTKSEEQVNAHSQYTPENVTERDYLRTDGDPGAAGYTIKEAVAVVRSMVPAQRSFALHLLASIVDKAFSNLQKQNRRCTFTDTDASNASVDWRAVWAYALGPEPEIALTMRIALDDNHNSVVLSCARVIQCLLCCDQNEMFFNMSEKSSIHGATFTAPVFRSKPEIGCGFLHGGYWKYNTKPSNILLTHDDDEEEENGEEDEAKRTIRDDVVVAGQDFAAGLVRMGVLPRICYLLETDPSPPLDEFLVSILVALARHSPRCADAVMKCPGLVQIIFTRFSKLTSLENIPYQIKTVMLFKVLSEANKQYCLEFIDRGIFQRTMLHLYIDALSLGGSVHSGKEQCKTSGLMVQQLRFWKVCIRYGYCLSYFSDFFPAMCSWLSPPTFGTASEKNFLGEYTSVTTEAFLVLDALCQKLSCVHSSEQADSTRPTDNGKEPWSWSYVVPMVELAMKWLVLPNIFCGTSVGSQMMSTNEDCAPSIHVLWVISAVMHMLSSIINRISPDTTFDEDSCETLPWLPDFVPKVGLMIVKNGFLKFVDSNGWCIGGQYATGSPLVEWLCQLSHGDGSEESLASACCLHGLVELIVSIDTSVQKAKASNCQQPFEHNSSEEDNILSDGISKSAQGDLLKMLNMFVNLVDSRWHTIHTIEMFGRGGPAPGVGLGWGSCGGGFWSVAVLEVQVYAWLLQSLYKTLPIFCNKDVSSPVSVESVSDWSINSVFPLLQKINSVIEVCSLVGPSDRFILEKSLKMLLQLPTFKLLDMCIHQLLHTDRRFKPPSWQFLDTDYVLFSKALGAHFHSRWVNGKKKSNKNRTDGRSPVEMHPEKNGKLETILEEVEISETTDVCERNSLIIEWAHQRLPLPIHWLLSPLCTASNSEAAQALDGSSNVKRKSIYSSGDPTEVVKSGLLFLLGLEALSYFLSIRNIDSPICHVPLVWNFHALSTMLIIKMDVLDDLRFRNIFENLQTLYGLRLQESFVENVKPNRKSSKSFFEASRAENHALDFQKQVHESYNIFIETFVEHYASVSYGDVVFGRQVALYLHRLVDTPVRLAAWNTLSNSHVLELLPPLENCLSEASGYLEPTEDNEDILEAYVKSWTSGALDRAALRGSMSFALALHHLSRFIFHGTALDKLLLRNRLVKSLLRGLSRKPNQERMMIDLIKYEEFPTQEIDKNNAYTCEGELLGRLSTLSEACEGSSSLSVELEKLKSSLML